MAPKQVDSNQHQVTHKVDPPHGRTGMAAVWIALTILYLLMRISLYLIWERANHG